MQTTFKTFKSNYRKSLKMKVWKKVVNILPKGQIACFEHFVLFSECFPNHPCRGVSKCPYEVNNLNLRLELFLVIEIQNHIFVRIYL